MQRLQESRKALGSQAILTIVMDDAIQGERLFGILWEQIADFEQRFSRFLTTSELTNFNTYAGVKIKISSKFQAMLGACQLLSTQTEGVFNPFILPALQKAGYVGSWPNPDSFETKLNYRDRTDVISIDHLQIGDGWALIPLASALDFGGIGKGYLLDQLASCLSENFIDDYWLSLGGDIICNGFDLDYQPWSVGIQDVYETDSLVGNITNKDGRLLAIATSGITRRTGVHAGEAWHHIINPQTGKPAETDTLSATLTAPNATQADVCAKCAVILGSTKAKRLLTSTGTLSIYSQTNMGKVVTYERQKEAA